MEETIEVELEKKVKELGLSPAQEKWLKRWIEGVSQFIARGPLGELIPETEKEKEAIMKLFLEKIRELKEYPERWKRKMLEVLA